MYGESPTRRPDEADVMGGLFTLLLLVAMLFLIIGVAADDSVPAPNPPYINAENYFTDVQFAVDGTIIKIYLDREEKHVRHRNRHGN